MRAFLGLAAVLSIAVAANAALVNADMENQPGGEFSTAEAWRETGGGWTTHAAFAAPNNGTLGEKFIFYSANVDQIMGQVSSLVFEANTPYLFTSWAIGGNNDTGAIPYQIGYLGPPVGDLPSIATDFVALATNVIDVTGQGQWDLQEGVSYMTGDAGAELGKNIVVRFGGVNQGGDSDIWVDNASLIVVPEPASLVLLALGGLLLRRR